MNIFQEEPGASFTGGKDRYSDEGVSAEKLLPGGFRLQVLPLAFGAGRLCIGVYGAGWYEDVWDYETLSGAIIAMEAWDGTPGTSPEGWYRHLKTGRRRPGGDPAKEYIQF